MQSDSFHWHGSGNKFNVKPTADTDYVVTVGTDKKIILSSGETVLATVNNVSLSATAGRNCAIFGCADKSHCSKFALYSMKLWQGGELVRDFVPASSNGVACLYDSVGDKFYTSSGSVALTAGAVKETSTDALWVMGEPYGYGPVEKYGKQSQTAGTKATYTMTDETVAVADGTRARCTGWEIRRYNPATCRVEKIGGGTGTSAEVELADPLVATYLVWQWEVFYKVTATTEQGSVTNALEWVKDGENFNTLFVPSGANNHFWRWIDADTNVVGTAAEISLAITKPLALTAEYKNSYYVSPTGDDTASGTSDLEPLKTIATALTKHRAIEVILADGLYDVTDSIKLDKEVTVRGANPGAKAIVRAGALLPGDDPSVFVITSPDAVLTNVAVTTKEFGANGYGRGIMMSAAALVTDCVITNCRAIYNKKGGGIWMSKGTVRRSVLDDNSVHASGGYNAEGGTIFMSGGLVEYCRITRGGLRHNTSSNTGGVLIQYGGTLRNCLVAYCTQGHTTYGTTSGTGVRVFGGTVENCTIAGNYQASSTVNCGFNIYGKSTVRNNIVWGNWNANGAADWVENGTTSSTVSYNCTTKTLSGTGNTTDDPAFVDAENGDYHTRAGAGVDAAAKLSWMTDDAVDLDGNPRILGAAPDMGCYEYVPPAIDCSFDVTVEGLSPATVTCTAKVQGTALTGLVYTWTITDAKGAQTTHSGSDLQTLVVALETGTYDISLTVSNDQSASATMTKKSAAFVAPKHIYCSPDGKSVSPYDSYANGATNLEDAVAVASTGSILHLDDGWFTLTNMLNVLKGVTLVSKNGPSKTTIYGTSQVEKRGLVYLGHSGITMDGITISGISEDGKTRPEKWGALEMAGGVLTNCWILGHKTVNNTVAGAGARISGGTVVDCIFSNNYAQCSGNGTCNGGGVQLSGANTVMDRCLIVDNKAWDGGTYQTKGGGVFLYSGLVRNCLIVGNSATAYGGGAALEGGRLVNCTVANSTTMTSNGGIWSNANGKIVDCLSYNNTANGIKEDIEDPGFVNAAAGDYHLAAGSSAIDAGTAADSGELDFEWNPRIRGAAADLGCYESDPDQFALGIGYTKLGGDFAPMEVEFRAQVSPSTVTLDAARTWWTFDGTEPSADNPKAVAGTVVTNTLAPGFYTVRFKTVYNDMTYAIDKTEWVKLYGATVYLVESNDNAEPPYATRETAATSMEEALKYALDGATLLVADGTYVAPSDHGVGRALVIRSENGPEKTILTQCNPRAKALTVKHAGALLTGFTFKDFQTWQYGATVYLTAGMVSNCVFTGSKPENDACGAVRVDGGTLVDCVITNGSTTYKCGTGTALAICGANALVDRCRIVDNRDATLAKGAVYMSAGTLRNSLVSGNALAYDSAIYATGGTVENCTVTGNTSHETGDYFAVAVDANVTFRNNVVWNNRNAAAEIADLASTVSPVFCLVGIDPLLRNAAKGDCRLWRSSPAVNAGTNLDWMVEGSLDLLRKPRVRAGRSDIGCCENPYEGLTVIVR